MEKAKVIKVWPSAHLEVKIHASEEMIKDFRKHIKRQLEK